MAVMIRLSGDAGFSFRVCVIVLRLSGDMEGSDWATSMRTTSPLLSPQASVDTAESRKLERARFEQLTHYLFGHRKLQVSMVPRRIELPTCHQPLRLKPIPVIPLLRLDRGIFRKLSFDTGHDGQALTEEGALNRLECPPPREIR
jgi:hypothetical protein